MEDTMTDQPDKSLENTTDDEQEDAPQDIPGDDTATSRPPTGDQQQAAINAPLNIVSIVEAVLFAGEEPIGAARLAGIVETGISDIRRAIQELNKKYHDSNCAFRIEKIAGGYQMLTLGCYNPYLKKAISARSDGKLGAAALETLAIIAYKQPIIRADIEAVRGVASGEVIRSLMYKGLAKITGRAEVLGRPLLYSTTRKFLEVFGLDNLKDLPKAEELKKPE